MATSFADQPVAQVLVSLAFLVAIVLITSLLTIRVQAEGYENGRWVQGISLLVMFFSLLNGWASFVILFGGGVDSCLWKCDALVVSVLVTYGLTKTGQHFFLAERLHLVYFGERPRHLSPCYWLFSCIVATIVGLAVFAIHSRKVELRGQHNHCYGGIAQTIPIASLVLAVILDSALSLAFLLPLMNSSFTGARRLTLRTAYSSLIMLIGIIVEYSLLIVCGGVTRGWIFAVVCIGDLTINSALLFYTTQQKSSKLRAPSLPDSEPITLVEWARRGVAQKRDSHHQFAQDATISGKQIEISETADEEAVLEGERGRRASGDSMSYPGRCAPKKLSFSQALEEIDVDRDWSRMK